MADESRVVTGDNAAPEKPSFSALVNEQRQAPPVEREPIAPAPAAEAAAVEQFNYDKWLEAQPREAIEQASRNFTGNVNRQLEQDYGELLPFMVEIAKDPELKRKMSRLTDAKAREFLLDTAYDVYQRTVAPNEQQAPQDHPVISKVTALENKLAERDAREAQAAYESQRGMEVQALLNQAPELKWQKPEDRGYKLAQHIIKVAEDRSRIAGRAIPYKDVWDEYVSLQGNAKTPSIPNTTPSGPPPSPQAPTTTAESRDRMLQTLQRAGGIRNLAQVASGRKR